MKLYFNVNKKKRRRGRHKKKRQDFWHHMQEYIWPSIGGSAFLRLLEIKVKRAKGSAHAVAFGLAAGACVSLTPFVGLHGAIALLLCYFFRGSYVMGVLGTLVGNPWTFPIIWISTYRLGNWMLQVENPPKLPKQLVPTEIFNNFEVYFYSYLWPMMVSGLPLGLVLGFLIYKIVYTSVDTYRSSRKKHLKERRAKWKTLLAKTKEFGGKIGEKVHDLEERLEEKFEERIHPHQKKDKGDKK